MSKTPNKIITDVAIISMDDDGIVIIDMKEGVVVDEIDVLNINLALRTITQGEPSLRLLDARANWKMTSKAKKAAEINNLKSNAIARAIWVNSIIKSTLLSFLSKFNTKDTPQKFFTDVDEAKKWLLGFRK